MNGWRFEDSKLITISRSEVIRNFKFKSVGEIQSASFNHDKTYIFIYVFGLPECSEKETDDVQDENCQQCSGCNITHMMEHPSFLYFEPCQDTDTQKLVFSIPKETKKVKKSI